MINTTLLSSTFAVFDVDYSVLATGHSLMYVDYVDVFS